MNEEKTSIFKRIFNLKFFAALLLLLVLLGGAYIFCGQQAKRHAAAIFNVAMAEQSSLKGTFTVETIDAHLDGTVNFTNLLWADKQNKPLLTAKKGSLKVNPLDVILRRTGARSLKAIELEEADCILDFDHNMQGDIIAADHKQEPHSSSTSENEERNVNLPDKIGSKELVLRNCNITVINQKLQYKLTQVNGKINYAPKLITLDVKTGKFGGTMVGDGLELSGQIKREQQPDTLDMQLKLTNVVPSSLGLQGVHNAVSLTGKITGTSLKPIIDGSIHFSKLDFPKMHFTHVDGKYHYENSVINVMDVNANIFGGSIDMLGEYHLRSRAHKIFITGHDLQADQYFQAENIHCTLQLELEMLNSGNVHNTIYRGRFRSGEGKYNKYAFNSMSAAFTIIQKNLHFKTLILDTDIGEFHAKSLDIVNGKADLDGLSWHPHHRIKRSKKDIPG